MITLPLFPGPPTPLLTTLERRQAAGPVQAKAKTVIRSMAAWAIRHGVHFYWMPNRAAAEKWTWILLDRFYQDVTSGKIK